MKILSKARLVWWLLIAVVLGAGRAAAVGTNSTPPISSGFLLIASNLTTTAVNTNVFFTNNPVTTFITISNTSPYVANSITYVTNDFSGAVTIVGYDTNEFGPALTAATNGNTLILGLQNIVTNPVSQLDFTWLPQSAGPVTNTISVGINTLTNVTTTNLVINQVYGANADLGVSNYFISQAYLTNDWVITNDWVTYGVTITNLGPGTATGVLVTNTLPPGTTVIASSQSYTTSGGTNLILTLGSLASGASATWQLTIQPATNGAFTLVDAVAAPNAYDTNMVDNTASAPLFVTNYLGTLPVGTNFAQNYNQLYNLYEQVIGATNTSATIAAGVRVVVTGLAVGQLHNASGTNNGQPFVVCPAPLAVNGQENLRLQFFPNAPAAFSNSQMQAYILPAPVLNYTPFPATRASTNLNITRLAKLKDGDMALQFNNKVGATYTVVYSTNANFSNAMIATPVISSQASSILWLDYGPPETISAPTNSALRFYRVYQNP